MVDRVEVPVEEGLEYPNQRSVDPRHADNTDGDLILGKFKSYEDLEKSYKELESKLGQSREAESNEPPPKPEAQQDWQPEDKLPDNNAETGYDYIPGVDNNTMEDISNYAWQNGSLTEEHYETLQNAGYSREMVDSYMAGQFAQAEASQSQLINAGGGAEKVQEMFDWAAHNLTQDQVDAYNERFDRGGSDAIMAMEHLAAKFDSAGGGYESRVMGANAPLNATAEPFRSVDQVREAMSDPRYQSDPAYREDVARRLAVSNVL